MAPECTTQEGPQAMSKDEINAFLGSGTSYSGQLTFEGAVRIDGVFVGEIGSEGTLIVGKDASIQGTVKVGQLVMSGTLTGEVFASRKVIMHRTGVINGTINAPAIVMEEGARLEGSVSMAAPSAN